MKVKVPVWHSLNKYLLLFTEVTYISSCGSHRAHSKTKWTIKSSRKFYGLQFNDFKYDFFFSHLINYY